MNTKARLLAVGLIASLTVFAGCSTPLSTREEGAGIGALGGAGVGGIIGAATGHAGAGAAIGGLLGLGAGALVGDQLQGREMQENQQQQQMNQQQREINRQQNEIERLKAGEY